MKAGEKKCPSCAEAIKLDAKVCKHCGHQFTDAEIAEQKAAAGKRTGIGCAVVLGLVLLMGYCASIEHSQSGGPSNASAGDTGVTAVQSATLEQASPSKWAYSDTKDEMRGTVTRFAEVTSDNEVEFDFPYNGGSTATLQVRKRPEDGLQILLSVSKGQFLCNSFTNTTVAVKFDNGPVRKFGCTDTSSGDTDVLFLSNPSTFLKSLRSSNTLMIEPQFYQAGGRQFTFKVAGLKWK